MYYNRMGERLRVNTSKMKYLGEGKCGVVYKNDKYVFKEYYDDISDEYRINLDIFDILRGIDNPHLVKLIDVYTKSYNSGLCYLSTKKEMSSDFRVDGYMAKFYRKELVDILDSSKDYLIENVYELEMLFNRLSQLFILTNDVKGDNVVLTDKGMVLIDPDMFYWCRDEKLYSFLKIANNENLVRLIREMLLLDLNKYKDNLELIELVLMKKIIKELTTISGKDCVSRVLTKKLKLVRKPIDYVYMNLYKEGL